MNMKPKNNYKRLKEYRNHQFYKLFLLKVNTIPSIPTCALKLYIYSLFHLKSDLERWHYYRHTHAVRQETLTCAGTASWRLFHSLSCLQLSLSASVKGKHTNIYISECCTVPVISLSDTTWCSHVYTEKHFTFTTSVRSSSLTAWMVSLHSANRVSYSRSFVSSFAAW